MRVKAPCAAPPQHKRHRLERMLFSSRSRHRSHPVKVGNTFFDSAAVKRAVDLCGALIALVIFSPLLFICAVAIRSRGARSVIFRQARVGLHGEVFEVLKLTTMKDDAHLSGPLVSKAKDLRATRVGRVIRAFGFNELPQLVNVIRGEMSIVGPRPEVPKYVALWSPDVKEKVLSVRPGITGTGTLRFWHEGSLLEGKEDVDRAYLEEIVPEKLRTEIWYVTHRTLWLDLRVMAFTLMRACGGSRLFRSNRSAAQVATQEEGS